MKRTRSRAIIAAAILLVGAGWTWHRQVDLNEQRASLTTAQTELDRTSRERAAADERLDSLRNEIAAERAQRDSALAAIALSGRQSVEQQRAARWNQPPAETPDWNPASPFVWLRKETVARMGVTALKPDASLTDEACSLLDIKPASRKAIDMVLRRGFAECRAGEAALARRSDEHLPQMRPNKGATVTVRVPAQPGLAARLRGEFNAVLLEQLGEQRARFLNRFAEGGIDSQLGPEKPVGGEAKAKVYSIQRDGAMFNIAVDTGNSFWNTGSPSWRHIIPEHLHPLFEEALEEK